MIVPLPGACVAKRIKVIQVHRSRAQQLKHYRIHSTVEREGERERERERVCVCTNVDPNIQRCHKVVCLALDLPRSFFHLTYSCSCCRWQSGCCGMSRTGCWRAVPSVRSKYTIAASSDDGKPRGLITSTFCAPVASHIIWAWLKIVRLFFCVYPKQSRL